MKTYRYAVFDLDGTLIDSYRALTTAINRTAGDLGQRSLTIDQVKTVVGEGVERLLQKVFGIERIDREVIRRFERYYDEVCCVESHILEEVETTLEHLSSANVKMVVCTNKPTGFSKKILDHFALSPYFSAVVGPDVAGARKPAAEHVAHAMRAMNASGPETLFVGDMPIDVVAARNASIDVAAIATGSSDAESLRAAAPDYLLDRFSDLERLFESEAR